MTDTTAQLVLTIDIDRAAESRATGLWAAACQAAYAALGFLDRHRPDGVPGEITPMEPWGHVGDVFEWRTYLHPADGSEPVYARLRLV